MAKDMLVKFEATSEKLTAEEVKAELWRLLNSNFLIKMGLKASGIKVDNIIVEER